LLCGIISSAKKDHFDEISVPIEITRTLFEARYGISEVDV